MTLRLLLAAAVLARALPAFAAPYQHHATNIVEQRAMHDLACTCATCNLEPIDTCQCELATKMRGEVKDALRGVDISTSDKREAAYRHVREIFAAKYGPSVLTPNAPKPTDPRMDWLPVLIFVGGALLLVGVTRRSIRRRRADTGRQ